MRRKKYIRVIFCLILIIILIGGIWMIINNFNNYKEQVNEETEEVNGSSLPDAPSDSSEYINLLDGEYQTANGYVLTIKDGVAYIDDNLIVNKTYKLPEDYEPTNPYSPITSDWGIYNINTEVMEAFKVMQSDASSIGLNIYIASGYRSYSYQETLYNNYVSVSGEEGADTYSSRPGYSEHQTGLCFDLNSVSDSFTDTDEGIWVNDNAYLYGFIIRYPKGKEEETGYQYESWHLRYVGVELATILYNNGDWISLEEYYGISSSY